MGFSVLQGDIMALLGSSGAGKKTSMAMMLDLVQPSLEKICIFSADFVFNRYRILARINLSSPYVYLLR